jgi:hypothetical protein
MLYREVIAVCSEIHTKHINTLRGGEEKLTWRFYREKPKEGDHLEDTVVDGNINFHVMQFSPVSSEPYSQTPTAYEDRTNNNSSSFITRHQMAAQTR